MLVSILTLLFCFVKVNFPWLTKQRVGEQLSSLCKASVCTQSLHLAAHRSLPPSPTSFNPFILLIHVPIIHPSTHGHSIDPLPQHAAVSSLSHTFSVCFVLYLWGKSSACSWVCSTLLHIHPAPQSHTWELPSITTAASCWLHWSSGGLSAMLKGTLSPLIVDWGISCTRSLSPLACLALVLERTNLLW